MLKLISRTFFQNCPRKAVLPMLPMVEVWYNLGLYLFLLLSNKLFFSLTENFCQIVGRPGGISQIPTLENSLEKSIESITKTLDW
jgi:hypothetical protein